MLSKNKKAPQYAVKFDRVLVKVPESITLQEIHEEFEKIVSIFKGKLAGEIPEPVLELLEYSHVRDLFEDGKSLENSISERLAFFAIDDGPRIFEGFYLFLKHTENFLYFLDSVKNLGRCAAFEDFRGFQKTFEKIFLPFDCVARSVEIRLRDCCRCFERVDDLGDEKLMNPDFFGWKKYDSEINFWYSEARDYLRTLSRAGIVKAFEDYAAAIDEEIIDFLTDSITPEKNPISNNFGFSLKKMEAL